MHNLTPEQQHEVQTLARNALQHMGQSDTIPAIQAQVSEPEGDLLSEANRALSSIGSGKKLDNLIDKIT